jgi:hypothetical protein
MSDQIAISKEALIDFVLWACSLGLKRLGEGVPLLLQEAVRECTTFEELLDLYFTTDFTMDEAAVALFDSRFKELENQL